MNIWYKLLCYLVVLFSIFFEIEIKPLQPTPTVEATATPNPMVIQTEDGFFLDEDLTRDLLCEYFESNGLKIKRSLFVPLIEKDDGGLYGGMERWFVTLEDGSIIPVWTKDGKIEYCYGIEWYYDIPIYP